MEALFRSERFLQLSLFDYVLLAYRESSGNTWERSRKSSTWEFCRYLKARPELTHLEIEALLEKLLTIVELSDAEQTGIADEWSKIEFAARMGILEWASKMPLLNPPHLKQLRLYVQFVSIAGHLQVLRGDKAIMLPVKELAEILHTTPQTISKLRSLAKKHELLTEVKPYKRGSLATEFRFAIDKFPALKERQ